MNYLYFLYMVFGIYGTVSLIFSTEYERVIFQTTEPIAMRKDISIEPFFKASGGSIRINYDPVSGNFLYNTLNGDLYSIYKEGNELKQRKLNSVADHGITMLQGFRMYDSLIFLVGNISSNNNRGTKGKVVRGKLNKNGSYNFEILAITEDYGRTGTIYSHEFNGIAVSPDGRFIYVNSGARTDHGELQENEGAYPGAREVPLTACIFRLPIDGNNIFLKNDSAYLANNGYLFSDGVRNAYDLAFSANGQLFGVSNSSDYDHEEEMNWLREGHHYGYPWIMGSTLNPQQFPNWDPDPEKDPFINPRAFAYIRKHFHNDPGFPQMPKDLKITPPVLNLGPDANHYRDRETGEIKDGSKTGFKTATFTPHRSPLGLVFDLKKVLGGDYKGDAFVLSWSNEKTSSLLRPFADPGGDLMQLKLQYEPDVDNYSVRSFRIAEGFNGPTDAVLVGKNLYVIEHDGMIWKVNFP